MHWKATLEGHPGLHNAEFSRQNYSALHVRLCMIYTLRLLIALALIDNFRLHYTLFCISSITLFLVMFVSWLRAPSVIHWRSSDLISYSQYDLGFTSACLLFHMAASLYLYARYGTKLYISSIFKPICRKWPTALLSACTHNANTTLKEAARAMVPCWSSWRPN